MKCSKCNRSKMPWQTEEDCTCEICGGTFTTNFVADQIEKVKSSISEASKKYITDNSKEVDYSSEIIYIDSTKQLKEIETSFDPPPEKTKELTESPTFNEAMVDIGNRFHNKVEDEDLTLDSDFDKPYTSFGGCDIKKVFAENIEVDLKPISVKVTRDKIPNEDEDMNSAVAKSIVGDGTDPLEPKPGANPKDLLESREISDPRGKKYFISDYSGYGLSPTCSKSFDYKPSYVFQPADKTATIATDKDEITVQELVDRIKQFECSWSVEADKLIKGQRADFIWYDEAAHLSEEQMKRINDLQVSLGWKRNEDNTFTPTSASFIPQPIEKKKPFVEERQKLPLRQQIEEVTEYIDNPETDLEVVRRVFFAAAENLKYNLDCLTPQDQEEIHKVTTNLSEHLSDYFEAEFIQAESYHRTDFPTGTTRKPVATLGEARKISDYYGIETIRDIQNLNRRKK